MNTAPFIERLQSQCPGFKFIGGALDLSEATLQAVQLPAAFVIPVAEAGEPMDMQGLRQMRVQTWAVAIVLKAMRIKAEQDQTAELQALRSAVQIALQGFQQTPQHSPTQFEAGQLEAMQGNAIAWIDQYTTTQTP